MVLAADFESAFESVSWEYLRSVIKNMNFGTNFSKMIVLLYLTSNNYSRIMMNDYLGLKYIYIAVLDKEIYLLDIYLISQWRFLLVKSINQHR